MDTHQHDSFVILRLVAERTRHFSFPNLWRPPIPPNEPATRELVNWGARAYSFSWIRHFSTLVNGIITLKDAGNGPSAMIVARSVFELGAHAHYVKKHLKQHLDARNMNAAWNFLTPITTGSRYINEKHPEESEMFPVSAHISKVIKCFGEVLPEDAQDGYSYLSEFCHPNMLAFLQYYRWPNPNEVQFIDHEPQGVFGSITAACIAGLLAIEEMLRLTKERTVLLCLRKLFKAVLEQSGGPETKAASA